MKDWGECGCADRRGARRGQAGVELRLWPGMGQEGSRKWEDEKGQAQH